MLQPKSRFVKTAPFLKNNLFETGLFPQKIYWQKEISILTIYSLKKPSKESCKKMLASIPKGLYTRKQMIRVIKENAPKYRKASKKEKTVILNDLCNTLHIRRTYIAHLLRIYSKMNILQWY